VAKLAAPGGLFTETIFVVNEYSKNNNAVQSITGSSSNPFNFLQDALEKAYELGAQYDKAMITIKMRRGV